MKKIRSTVIALTAISLLGKFVGLLRELLLAYFYGTSNVVDAYLVAITIPSIVFGWITALGIGYIPIYTEINIKQSFYKAKIYTSKLITFAFLISSLCLVITLFFKDNIVYIVAQGFDKNTHDLTVLFLQGTICVILLITPIQILISYLNCNGSFVFAGISNLVLSVIQSVVIVFSGMFSSTYLGYSFLASYLVQIIILYIFCRRLGYKYQFLPEIDTNVKTTIISVVPIFFSNMITDIGNFIDKMLASGLPEGSVSALNYAFTFRAFFHLVFTAAMTSIIYPLLSEYAIQNENGKLKDVIYKCINIISIIFVPLTIGVIVLAKQGLSLILVRGEFDDKSLSLTVSAFILYSLSLLNIAIRDVIIRVFYALREAKLNLLLAGITLILNLIFDFILIKSLGHNGLAAAASISTVVVLPLYFVVLSRKIGGISFKKNIILGAKALIASVIMGIIVYIMRNQILGNFENTKVVLLFCIAVCAMLGAVIYYLLLKLFKVSEVRVLENLLKSKFKNIVRGGKL